MVDALHSHAASLKSACGVDLVVPEGFPLVKLLCFAFKGAQALHKRLKHLDVVVTTLFFSLVEQLLTLLLQMCDIICDTQGDDRLLREFEDEEDKKLGMQRMV